MKKLITLLLCSIFVSFNLFAQKIEVEKTHQLSKDAKKGYLGSFNYDETAKEYTLVFVREKKNKAVYVTYKFDYDFNQIGDITEEKLTDLEASAKFDFIDFTDDPWPNPKVIRVGNLTDRLVLRQGVVKRDWIEASKEDMGSYSVYTPGHYIFVFEELKKIKPTFDVEELKDLPKFIQKGASKIWITTYATDEPSFEAPTNQKFKFFIGTLRTYNEASGDLLVIGYQQWMLKNKGTRRIVALQYDAETLKLKNKTFVDFGADVVYGSVISKKLFDGSIAVIYAPSNTMAPKPVPKRPRDYFYVRFSKNAEVIEKIPFESPSSKWEINDLLETSTGDVIAFGAAYKKKNDKCFDKLNNPKYDNFQIMKISKGKIEYITSTDMAEFESKLKFPKGMKKIDSYDGKKFNIGDVTLANNGDVFISGQIKDGEKFGNIYLFHFDGKGILKAQYGYKLEEGGNEIENVFTEFQNKDKNTLWWIVYEAVGATESKALYYPRIASIDIESANVSGFTQMYNKDSKYYVDNNKPIILIEDGDKVVFFGADKKDKKLWFSRVKLGK